LIIDATEYLAHYGTPRHSGRYPYGSGEDPHQGSRTFLADVESMKRQGLSEVEIARGLGMTVTELRNTKTVAKNEKKQADISMAQRLKDKGYSNVAIGKRMGIPESSVRSLLAPGEKDKAQILDATATMLKQQVDEKHYLDVGSNTHYQLNVSDTKLRAAVSKLKDQGYEVHNIKIEQLGTGHQTELKVLARPGTTQKEVWQNRTNVQQIIGTYSEDGGRSFLGLLPPLSVSSKRIGVRYAEQGGTEADGVIYVRPGVHDLSLGGAHYAQVRIAVDGSHYLKGMAMYHDGLPDGVDLVFNTNKHDTGNKLDAMKKMKDDPDNPFGSVVRQIKSQDGKRVVSAMNLVNEEGDWLKWSKNLSSQMLSKQSPVLAKQQLDMTYEQRKNEFDSIRSLTNPSVKKRLLESFADGADAAAVHLKAAGLPRQRTQVILPINSMKPTEIYAPKFRNGERVVLVRYPHGGKFEIPELTVNNRHPEAKRLIGKAQAAVGINHKVAERLSGADFDGDTVIVIPNNSRQVKTEKALAGLKNFDPQSAYPHYEGMQVISPSRKQQEMGKVSNLITDMTIRGATHDELARAVRHSMVVIDAEKHKLDWKRSEQENGIAALKQKYQKEPTGGKSLGASTIISRAGSAEYVPQRKQGFRIDPNTGQKIYTETGATKLVRTVSKRTGAVTEKTVPKTQRSTKLAETNDAHTLSSGLPIERVYADHSNRLKSLANEARKELVRTHDIPYSPSARRAYEKQVASLTDKLHLALRNAPLERQAQVLANSVYAAKKKANPDMDEAEKKKLKGLALDEARRRTGAGKQQIDITPDEWTAIQHGAISPTRLRQILHHADVERIKELATPRSKLLMTPTKKARAERMLASGYTYAEIADHLGVAQSTLEASLNG
jgi:DNA-directed RNA polymerase specialized sigma24 family protein